ncbi:signal peptidase I [Bacillus cereus]|uniref:Signal peptidase I n=1 Tax=Bacillus cereus TaxID=1396 RepID=A0A9X7QNF3_BACCE|nr:signal peptidase I [Bacillus cereus]
MPCIILLISFSLQFSSAQKTLQQNHKEQKEGYLDHTLLEEYKQLNYPETEIPSHKVFVMGDNRLNSIDSRTGLGDIDVSSIVGKAEFVFYPFNRVRIIN